MIGEYLTKVLLLTLPLVLSVLGRIVWSWRFEAVRRGDIAGCLRLDPWWFWDRLGYTWSIASWGLLASAMVYERSWLGQQNETLGGGFVVLLAVLGWVATHLWAVYWRYPRLACDHGSWTVSLMVSYMTGAAMLVVGLGLASEATAAAQGP